MHGQVARTGRQRQGSLHLDVGEPLAPGDPPPAAAASNRRASTSDQDSSPSKGYHHHKGDWEWQTAPSIRWCGLTQLDRQVLANTLACAGASMADPLMSLVGGNAAPPATHPCTPLAATGPCPDGYRQGGSAREHGGLPGSGGAGRAGGWRARRIALHAVVG